MTDAESAISTLQALKALGVRLAIDDFGTGYSSLSYLRRLPVDALKIDGSFVDDLGHDNGAATIARAVIDLGHALGLEVVAEGVENRLQFDQLRAAGCRLGQGHYFSRPLPPTAIDALLKRTNVARTVAVDWRGVWRELRPEEAGGA